MRVVDVIIPAYNEEDSIGKVIRDIPKDITRRIIVGNNGSTDQTAENAKVAGAVVVDEPRPGYGSACLAAMEEIASFDPLPDAVVFIDGDYSDFPEQMVELLGEIEAGFDLVIGSRALGDLQKGSMTPAQLFGNWLATNLIRLIYKVEFTDLGPFRAIRYNELVAMEMKDKDFGWTVEMQVKAIQRGLRVVEVPVSTRRRVGRSKISGTVSGVIGAALGIFGMIFSLWRQGKRGH